MFGMSVFQSVVERLKAERDMEGDGDAAGDVQAWRSPIDRSPAFVMATPACATPALNAVARAYRELAPAERTEPPVMPAHLKRTSLADVAEELAIAEDETTLTLAAKRRHFAAANHPDRLPAEFRANATVRMKLANMLIDEATRRLVRP
ncbi:hypothetical protein [Sinorhizobium alkalisoli]|uniref:Uncharacterized protein n=1 Tax=Sinorhizobium alkalisoli TaxID=1752398 RepID=A0A1E3VDH7_9HYPH|nr:hypothetical protein [Sinorhizobium alkalisoli]MCA1490759.1 hypothetical protein [Ensifer sp. NBAIM29]MCG5480758.1 hypothetical protein [Sinorhizobium alkalisoli]ODR91622.1 hypothetical protein A8M32_09250 [Sinorhizobium alkalisoli]